MAHEGTTIWCSSGWRAMVFGYGAHRGQRDFCFPSLRPTTLSRKLNFTVIHFLILVSPCWSEFLLQVFSSFWAGEFRLRLLRQNGKRARTVDCFWLTFPVMLLSLKRGWSLIHFPVLSGLIRSIPAIFVVASPIVSLRGLGSSFLVWFRFAGFSNLFFWS